jgi:sulfide:quinone oxidoreductase
MAKVLVLGGNFGGLTVALSIKYALNSDADVKVISASDRFLFNPSLIWLPFGKRTAEQITFPLEPTYTEAGVEFVHAEAKKIDPERRKVTAGGRDFDYDYLVIATGYRNDFGVVEGLGKNGNGNATTITTLADAERAGEAWKRYLKDPGDVVVAATQGAGCFGAAYEFLFNASYQLKKAGLKGKVKLTYVTSEPFLGHFGIGGMPGGEAMLKLFLKKDRIDYVTDMAMEYVDRDHTKLRDGRTIPFKFAMIVPPFLGQDVVRDAPGIGDAKGYAPVRDTYQTKKYDNVYAVGIAAGIPLPWTTPTPTGMPKTGFPTEKMAHVAAHNIVSQIRGKPAVEEKAFSDIPAVCVMDAGNNGVLVLGTAMLPPRKAAIMIPGPQNHAFKLAFEKYYLWKMRSGHVNLP